MTLALQSRWINMDMRVGLYPLTGEPGCGSGGTGTAWKSGNSGSRPLVDCVVAVPNPFAFNNSIKLCGGEIFPERILLEVFSLRVVTGNVVVSPMVNMVVCASMRFVHELCCGTMGAPLSRSPPGRWWFAAICESWMKAKTEPAAQRHPTAGYIYIP